MLIDPTPFEPAMPERVRAVIAEARAGRGPLAAWVSNREPGWGQVGDCFGLLRGHPERVDPDIVGWAVGIAMFGDDLYALPRVITRERLRAPLPFVLDALAAGLAARVPTLPRQWKSIETLVTALGSVPAPLVAVLPLGLLADQALARGAALRLAQRAGEPARRAIEAARQHASKKELRRLDEALAALGATPAASSDEDDSPDAERPPPSAADAVFLRRLVEAWGATKDPRLVEPIAALGALVARQRGPLKARSKGELEGAWLALAAARDPADVDRLTGAPWPRAWKTALARIEALAKMQPDPRIVRAALAQAPEHSSLGSYPLHGAIARLVERAADPDALELAEAAQKSRPPGQRDYLLAIDACRRAQHTDADDALVAEARAATRPPAGLDALWRAFWDDPRDEERRLVLADALERAGDPRGELIALQHALAAGRASAAAKRRVSALLDAHIDTWCGALPELERSSRRFERGFLVSARCMASPAQLERTMDVPEWRTLETLVLDARDGGEALVRRMPCLMRLTVRGDVVARALWDGAPLPLRALAVLPFVHDFVPTEPSRGLPSLALLATTWRECRWQWDGALFREHLRAVADARIPALSLGLGHVPIAELLRIWRDVGPPELRLGGEGFDAVGWVLRVRRASPVAELAWCGRGWGAAQLGVWLDALADAGFARAAIHAGKADVDVAAQIERIAARGVTVRSDGSPIDLGALPE